MVLKNVSAAALGTMLLAWSSLSMADGYRPAEYRASEYRASEFLGLDLSSAVLSPKPLGPATEFAPVAVEAKADRGGEAASVRVARVTHPGIRVAHLRNAKARGAVRVKLARRHGNPLDAQAFDTRIEVWPCRSGGICNWKRN